MPSTVHSPRTRSVAAVRTRPARPRAVAAAALGTALGVVLAGCSGGAPGVRASDVARPDRARTRDGGTLRWAVDTVPATFNVFQPAADSDSELVARAVLPALFRLDDHARAAPDPDYLVSARSFAPSARRRYQTVVYQLNPRAVWSDGRPLSAADFAAQWKALSGRDPAFHAARADGYDAIASVGRGAGPHEVRVVFRHPFGPWRSLFTPLYPAAATSSPGAFNDGSREGLTASAGPFELRAPDRAAGRVTLVRNPRWWGDRAKLERIDLLAMDPRARPAALARGLVDVAPVERSVDVGEPTAGPHGSDAVPAAGSPAAAAAVLHRLESIPGVTLHRAAGAAWTQLTLNGGSGPLADVRVRRAVARAIDRRRIAEAVLRPLGLPVVTLGNHLLMADQEGYRDDSGALGSTGPEVAGHLLDAAGWRMSHVPGDAASAAPGRRAHGSPGTATAGPGDAARPAAAVPLRARAGRPLVLRVLIPKGSVGARTVAGRLAAQLARAGIGTRVHAVDPDDFFGRHVATGDFDIAVFSWPAAPFPVAGERFLYGKPRPAQDGILQAGLNYARVGTDEIDALLARSSAELDTAAATRLIREADVRIWRLAPSLPLFQRPEIVAVRDGVLGAGAFGFAGPRFQDIGFARS